MESKHIQHEVTANEEGATYIVRVRRGNLDFGFRALTH